LCAKVGTQLRAGDEPLVRVHRLSYVTRTTKLTEPCPMLPATSVAVAETVFVPRLNVGTLLGMCVRHQKQTPRPSWPAAAS
jgi:hypothetical protein